MYRLKLSNIINILNWYNSDEQNLKIPRVFNTESRIPMKFETANMSPPTDVSWSDYEQTDAETTLRPISLTN